MKNDCDTLVLFRFVSITSFDDFSLSAGLRFRAIFEDVGVVTRGISKDKHSRPAFFNNSELVASTAGGERRKGRDDICNSLEDSGESS